jgi:hypothetical protein
LSRHRRSPMTSKLMAHLHREGIAVVVLLEALRWLPPVLIVAAKHPSLLFAMASPRASRVRPALI